MLHRPAAPAETAAAAARPATLAHRALRGFESLRVRNYRLFFSGQVISQAGTWMQITAQAWLVISLTNSPLALGAVIALQYLPIALFALYGGVLADRLPKRRTLIVTQSLLMLQAFIFGALVATGWIQLWQVYVLAMCQGAINAIDAPVRQAFAVEMVGREDLPNAVALNSLSINGAKVIGPALAGVIIAQIGVAAALILNAISFLPVIAGLLLMREAELHVAPRRPHGSTRQELAEGLAYTWHTPKVLAVIIVAAAVGTFGFNFTVVLPLLANFVLHTTPAGFGLLSACFGIGALVTAISTAYVRTVTMRRLLVGSGLFSILLGVVAFSHVFVVSAILLAVLGAAGIVFTTSNTTLLQLLSPDELRGRVMSLSVLLIAGTTPIGGFLIGALSAQLGVQAALLFCAALCLAGVVGALLYLRRTGADGPTALDAAPLP